MRIQFGKTIVLVVMLPLIGCQTQNITQQSVPVPVTVKKVLVKPIELPKDRSDSLYVRLFDREAVVHFYRTQNFRSVWFDALRRSTASADSMVSFVRDIRYFGLLPDRYHLMEIEQLKISRETNCLERTEVLLTDAFLRIANDLSAGVSAVHPWRGRNRR